MIARLCVLVLFALSMSAQVFTLTRDQMMKFTAENPYDRFPDGRPKVPDELLEKAVTARSGASDRRRSPWRPRCCFPAPGSAIFPRLAETLRELVLEARSQLEFTAAGSGSL
jgi:hypothetical protein